MIPKENKELKKRRVRLFLIFLVGSALAWFVSRLSDTYANEAMFEVEYKNPPDTLSLVEASTHKIPVKLRAKGFQFLGFDLKSKKIVLDLSKIQREGKKFYLSKDDCRRQIESQLPGSMALLDLETEKLYFDFYAIETKEVPITSLINFTLLQNYMADGKMDIRPDKITIHGPKEEIDTILGIKTLKTDLSGLTTDFRQRVPLQLPEGLKNTTFSSDYVTVYGKVFRFSEKLIEVPVKVVNLPSGLKIRTFPDRVELLCKSKIGDLKKMESTDFLVVADYNTWDGNSSILDLTVQKSPKNLKEVVLQQTQVEFILKKE